jgi:hypothetical protein
MTEKTVINGHIAVTTWPNGRAEIEQDDLDGAVVVIPEDREALWRVLAPPAPAVAITEAQIEAAAAAFWASDTMMGQTQSDWDDVTPRWREMVRRDALAILNAALAAAAQAQPGTTTEEN